MAEFTVSAVTHAAALIDIAVLEGGSYINSLDTKKNTEKAAYIVEI